MTVISGVIAFTIGGNSTMQTTKKYAALVSSTLLVSTALSGCASDGSFDLGKTVGTTLGAAAGFGLCQLANGSGAECALAALAGAAAGYIIADQIKPEDKEQRDATVGSVLTTDDLTVGESFSYSVAETGSTGQVKLLGLTTDSRGWECKQLEEDYSPTDSDGISETYTMCRNPETNEWENA